MDKLTVKTPSPKCRPYSVSYLIKFIDWRYNQSRWHFRPALWTITPLPSLWLLLPPPFPRVNKYTVHTYTVRKEGGGEYEITGGEGASDRYNACREVPLQVKFFSIWHCFLSVKSFYALGGEGADPRPWLRVPARQQAVLRAGAQAQRVPQAGSCRPGAVHLPYIFS